MFVSSGSPEISTPQRRPSVSTLATSDRSRAGLDQAGSSSAEAKQPLRMSALDIFGTPALHSGGSSAASSVSRAPVQNALGTSLLNTSEFKHDVEAAEERADVLESTSQILYERF